MESEGKIRLPRQEVAEGQVHGYIGEAEGLVETFDAPKAGSSNAVPDLETSERRVANAKLQLADAERQLEAAHKGTKAGENKAGGADDDKGYLRKQTK